MSLPEPWLRGTVSGLDPIRSQLLYSFEQAIEDIERFTTGLSDAGMCASPFGLAPVCTQIRHIVGSVDRLLTYAVGQSLSEQQMAELQAETQRGGTREELLSLLREGLQGAAGIVGKIDPTTYEQPRFVGRKRLSTTAGNLLVHVAEHTQRHVGQLITTAKVVAATEDSLNVL